MTISKVTFFISMVALVMGETSYLHSAPVHHGSTVIHEGPVHHSSSDYHGGSIVHGGPVIHGGPAVHGGSVIHGGPVIHGGGVHQDNYKKTSPHYNFAYGVHDDYTGTNFGHTEARDGYKTEGKYFVNLPDGRIQTVKYYADENGYHPEVSYEGVAHYDTNTHHKSGPVHGGSYHK